MAIYRDNLSAIVIGDMIYRLPISLLQCISLSPINYRDTRFFMHTMINVSEFALSKKYTVLLKCCCNLKTSLFVLFNATTESVNCSLFLKNLETHFNNVTCKKNFVKIIETLPRHLSENFIGDNLSITNIALKN